MEKIKAKKRFGQNFLKDETTLNKIIQAIPKIDCKIVEIGPGLGDLTFWLLRSGYSVISYEIDDELIPILSKKFYKEAKDGQFKLIHKDANAVWLQNGSLCDEPYILVANLPYYVATKMVLSALQDERCSAIVAMTQKEVAVKFTCDGKKSEFSALGVLANVNAVSNLLFDVAPSCFEPAPKVTSAVFRTVKNERKLFGNQGLFENLCDYKNFKLYLKACFSAPRKMLIKNLSDKYGKGMSEEIFSELGISSSVRPHESNVALYLKIYNLIKVKNEREQ